MIKSHKISEFFHHTTRFCLTQTFFVKTDLIDRLIVIIPNTNLTELVVLKTNFAVTFLLETNLTVSFLEIGHKIISMAILSLQIQVGQLSVTGRRTCT